MPLFVLDDDLKFPPVHFAEPDGLLAIGGDLSVDRLLVAYRNGIFPWYQDEHILWWSPDPRFVLYPSELKISKAFKAAEKKNQFEFTINKAFKEVIHHCKKIDRHGQEGTWITDEVEEAFCKLHKAGYAHSTEAWQEGELVGGLYGIRLGKVFFGESMFSMVSNASRFAFTKYVQQLHTDDIELIDCQVYTEYLESFGARMIDRTDFIRQLDLLIPA